MSDACTDTTAPVDSKRARPHLDAPIPIPIPCYADPDTRFRGDPPKPAKQGLQHILTNTPEPSGDEQSSDANPSSRRHIQSGLREATAGHVPGASAIPASPSPSKRTSFLPQPGLPRPNPKSTLSNETQAPQTVQEAPAAEKTSDTSASARVRTAEAKPGRLRAPVSYQTRSSRQDASAPVSIGTASSSRPANADSKQSASAGLTRSKSLRLPAAAAQHAANASSSSTATASARTRTHARTQSAYTSAGVHKNNADRNEPVRAVEGPRSLMPPPSQTRASRNPSTETAPGAVRASARVAANRTANARPKPASSHSRTASSTPAGAEDRLPVPESRAAFKPESKKLARPAFSTLQQHFTPRKVGKAPTSTFLQPAPEPAGHVLPPEIISLQNELLQLHLLHESCASTNMLWELSAQKKLKAKFDHVAGLNRAMQDNERFGQEQKNMLALREWNGSNSVHGLVEPIQALSGPLHELPSLLDSGGRFTALVEQFSTWFSWVEQVWNDRKGFTGKGSVMSSLEGLGDAWRVGHAAITRKLTAFSQHLDSLPPARQGSSIAHIVSSCQLLVDGLLKELQMMQELEIEVVTREEQWVEERLRYIARDAEEPHEMDEEAWRMY